MQEIINYKGIDIKVWNDEYAESPQDWADTNIFLVGYDSGNFHVEAPLIYRRDKDGGRVPGDKGHVLFTKQEVIEILKAGKHEGYHVFGLEAYIHSGVALYLSGGCQVDRAWDVSQLGAVFIAKDETRYRTKAKKIATSLISTWNDYLSGSIYGYTVDETKDSCGGFYGYDHEKSGLLENARDCIDVYLKDKEEILHSVCAMA